MRVLFIAHSFTYLSHAYDVSGRSVWSVVLSDSQIEGGSGFGGRTAIQRANLGLQKFQERTKNAAFLDIAVNLSASGVFAPDHLIRGSSPPDHLIRGSTPGPRWGLCP